ncbi:unnamed protein product [Urochloa decumbens]|uniref:Dirigent protein n=1 Tax=Urochloa decumbens TaxID=240449 RepID=A0ABC9B9I3_9POAL
MAANPSFSTLLFAFLFLPAVLTTASLTDYNAPPSLVGPLLPPLLCPCNCPKENETRLHLYLHQLPAWPNVPNTNEVNVVMTPSIGFGQMYVDDWFLTAGTDPNGKIVGRAHGFHIQAGQKVQSWYTSHIFEFQDDWFAGSTLHVLGLSNSQGQWFITGGTGTFTNAHGTVKFSTSVGSAEIIHELDIHVFYTPETP